MNQTINGLKEGYWEDLDGNSKGNYIRGIRDGYWIGYFINGNLSYRGCYTKGEFIGYWEWFAFNQLYTQEIYL